MVQNFVSGSLCCRFYIVLFHFIEKGRVGDLQKFCGFPDAFGSFKDMGDDFFLILGHHQFQ